jgi:hypothetical protein
MVNEYLQFVLESKPYNETERCKTCLLGKSTMCKNHCQSYVFFSPMIQLEQERIDKEECELFD